MLARASAASDASSSSSSSGTSARLAKQHAPLPPVARPPTPPSRRAVLAGLTAAPIFLGSGPASAVGFKKELKPRRGSAAATAPLEAYTPADDGAFATLDTEPGTKSPPIHEGDTVTVHFDSLFRGIDVASSRSARLLGGNRTIAEPFTFTAGGPLDAASRAARPAGDSAGGLFSGAAGPQPPPALSRAVLGMRAGGKRSVLIPEGSPAGYGSKGLGEIPPNGGFELQIEVLDVVPVWSAGETK